MKLSDFVEETLLEIVKGTHRTNEKLKADGIDASVNPARPAGYRHDPQDIEFDVAVTVESSEMNNVNGGIQVYSLFKTGGERVRDSATSSVSRIKFTVPLRLPKGVPAKPQPGEVVAVPMGFAPNG